MAKGGEGGEEEEDELPYVGQVPLNEGLWEKIAIKINV
jgi:hypothetical protein